jgi:uncharacterized protein YeaO (DUF488 family)
VPVLVVRLGSPRRSNEGLRLGTVRRPPRGIPRDQYAALNHYDLWLPELAPSASLLSWARKLPLTEQRWRTFARRYQAEMRQPSQQRLMALLAALSARQNFSVGCYCEDESRCHRSLLRELLRDAGAVMGPKVEAEATRNPAGSAGER